MHSIFDPERLITKNRTKRSVLEKPEKDNTRRELYWETKLIELLLPPLSRRDSHTEGIFSKDCSHKEYFSVAFIIL